jgi:hypothetical protein
MPTTTHAGAKHNGSWRHTALKIDGVKDRFEV